MCYILYTCCFRRTFGHLKHFFEIKFSPSYCFRQRLREKMHETLRTCWQSHNIARFIETLQCIVPLFCPPVHIYICLHIFDICLRIIIRKLERNNIHKKSEIFITYSIYPFPFMSCQTSWNFNDFPQIIHEINNIVLRV